jgi:fructokinase
MQLADIAKLNHEELPRVTALLHLPHGSENASLESQAQTLLRAYNLKLVCITRGADGSILVSNDQIHEHSGFATQVIDTVGAGDAFTAALVHHYLHGSSLHVMNEAANRMGAWVASNAGATPEPDAALLERIRIAR